MKPHRKGLYVHIPFCAQRCFYCSFATVVGQQKRQHDFITALLQEASYYENHPFDSVYIGGGTPNMLSVSSLQRLADGLRDLFHFSEVCEWSLELNPEGLTSDWGRFLKKMPFNRFSLGVQTFDEIALRFLGRKHSPDQARAAFHRLRENGASNINIDLIVGWDGQTSDRLKRDLDEVLRLRPEHVSVYALTVESPSRFAVCPVALLCDECQRDLLSTAAEILQQAGYIHYEVSNFSRPGFMCQHNMNVWLGGDYIGIGPSAHSRIGPIRWQNCDNFFNYLKRVHTAPAAVIATCEILTPSQCLNEALAFGMRLNQEIDLEVLEKDHLAFFDEKLSSCLKRWEQCGWIKRTGKRCFKITGQGFWFLDNMASDVI